MGVYTAKSVPCSYSPCVLLRACLVNKTLIRLEVDWEKEGRAISDPAPFAITQAHVGPLQCPPHEAIPSADQTGRLSLIPPLRSTSCDKQVSRAVNEKQ
jgi:hypothetical protein